jgi:hypothetical protein
MRFLGGILTGLDWTFLSTLSGLTGYLDQQDFKKVCIIYFSKVENASPLPAQQFLDLIGRSHYSFLFVRAKQQGKGGRFVRATCSSSYSSYT